MKAQLSILASSLALTVLIWTYADRAEHENIDLDVMMVLQPLADYRVTVDDAREDTPDQIAVPVSLTGPRAAIRRLERDRAAGRTTFTLEVVVTDRIETGTPLSMALAGTRLLPPHAVGIVAHGERSGHVDASLLRLADHLGDTLDARMRRFEAWLEPFADLGAETVTMRRTGGTDHQPFDWVGIPGFQFIQDSMDYMGCTHHSNVDTYDHLNPDDLKKSAVILASFIWHAANRDELLPRKPMPMEPKEPAEKKKPAEPTEQ